MPNRPVRLALLSAESSATCAAWYEPFNYSVRKIEAAVRADPTLQHVETIIVDGTGDSTEECAQRLDEVAPDIVGVSTYYWSFPALFRATRELKRRRPDCLLVYGGPSAAPEMFSVEGFTDGHEFVDGLVLGEGELVIRQILSMAQLTRSALLEIPGLAVAGPTGWTNTGAPSLPILDEIPSPLQMGLLPPGTSGHLETFRGCPMSCKFCEWGETGAWQRAFSEEYLIRELRALKEFQPKGVFLIDAGLNLNAKAFRNLAAAEKEVGILRSQPVHTECYPSHLNEAQLEFLSDISIASIGIGLQSYDKEVNRRLGRPHDADRFERVVNDVLPIASSTWIEIILGLPGDDPDSFMVTLDRALKLGAGVRVARCLVLPKALLARSPAHFAMDFNPENLTMRSCWGWPGDSIERTARIVSDMVEAQGGISGPDLDYWAFPQSSPGAPKYSWTELKPMHYYRTALPPEEPAEEESELNVVLADACRDAVMRGSNGSWEVISAKLVGERTELTVSVTATISETFIIRIERAEQVSESYQKLDDLAYSYNDISGQPLPAISFATLRDVIAELHMALRSKSAGHDYVAALTALPA